MKHTGVTAGELQITPNRCYPTVNSTAIYYTGDPSGPEWNTDGPVMSCAVPPDMVERAYQIGRASMQALEDAQ